MQTRGENLAMSKAEPAPPEYLDARTEFAKRFLAGDGLEIGALNWPLDTPPGARVQQVDRMTTEDLRAEYPEVADGGLLEVDIVDNGETLATVEDGSQDFIVANHFLEHTEDPIGTIGIHLAKLKPGGVLFYAVPDKRYTFDFRRESTPLEHMIRDHEEGPQRSRRAHFDEWTLLVGGTEEDRASDAAHAAFELRAREEARRLEEEDFSIHMHVWDQASFFALLLHCRGRFQNFNIEATAQRALELVVVLRKTGAWPPPPTPPESAAQPEAPAPLVSPRRSGLLGQRLRRRADRNGEPQ